MFIISLSSDINSVNIPWLASQSNAGDFILLLKGAILLFPVLSTTMGSMIGCILFVIYNSIFSQHTKNVRDRKESL